MAGSAGAEASWLIWYSFFLFFSFFLGAKSEVLTPGVFLAGTFHGGYMLRFEDEEYRYGRYDHKIKYVRDPR